MAMKRRKAREAAQDRGGGELWLDHAAITHDDLPWLMAAEKLTLLNVTVPDGFLARLPKLWWLDLRGGTATDLAVARGCARLRYLQVNQVRGMRSLALLPRFSELQLLSLYGLPQVKQLPSLARLGKLRRLQLGMMGGLVGLSRALAAPGLNELYLSKKIAVRPRDVAQILAHPTLAQFNWNTEDVPDKTFVPVFERIKLPRARAMLAQDWFGSQK
jgi:hypothetical protein